MPASSRRPTSRRSLRRVRLRTPILLSSPSAKNIPLSGKLRKYFGSAIPRALPGTIAYSTRSLQEMKRFIYHQRRKRRPEVSLSVFHAPIGKLEPAEYTYLSTRRRKDGGYILATRASRPKRFLSANADHEVWHGLIHGLRDRYTHLKLRPWRGLAQMEEALVYTLALAHEPKSGQRKYVLPTNK